MATKLTYEFKLKVEVARYHHLDVMGEIAKVSAPKWYKRSYLKTAIRHKRTYVALVGKIPGAFLVWNRDFYGYYFIDLLVVHPELRRKGLARLLIRAMEKRCTGRRLYTSTNRSNKVMQQVMKRMGYKRVGYISNVDRGDPEWIYYKKL